MKLCPKAFREPEDPTKPLVFDNYKQYPSFVPGSKLAIFDLDDTLTTTKSGNFFTKDLSDWKLKYQSVPDRLKELVADGFTIVIISNQMGISREHIKQSDFQNKIEQFWEAVNLPILVLAASRDDEYRKPAIGTFLYLMNEVLKLSNPRYVKPNVKQRSQTPVKAKLLKRVSKKGVCDDNITNDGSLNNSVARSVSIKLTGKRRRVTQTGDHYLRMGSDSNFALGYEIHESSFFCGDAAGRESKNTRDFSNTDLLFAHNCRLNFYLPEQVFLRERIPPLIDTPVWQFGDCIETNKTKYLKQFPKDEWECQNYSNILVLLIGPSSSGKTELCNNVFSDYSVVRYVHKEKDAFSQMLMRLQKSVVKSGFKVIVDAINADVNLRSQVISKLGTKLRDTFVVAIDIKLPLPFVRHLNKLRFSNQQLQVVL